MNRTNVNHQHVKIKHQRDRERNQMHDRLTHPRGLISLRTREDFLISANYNIVLVNATLAIPYTYAYLNLSSPTLLNSGSAPTSLNGWNLLSLLMRKYVSFNMLVRIDYDHEETFGVEMFACPVNFIPTATIAEAQASLSNPRCVKQITTNKLDRGRLTVVTGLWEFGGFSPRNSEDAHWGTVNPLVPPIDSLYLHLGSDTNGAASVTGTRCNITVLFLVKGAEINHQI